MLDSRLQAEDSRVSLQHMGCVVEENSRDVTFLYKLLAGVCSKSYGLNVAAMAGIPKPIIDLAEEKVRTSPQLFACSPASPPRSRSHWHRFLDLQPRRSNPRHPHHCQRTGWLTRSRSPAVTLAPSQSPTHSPTHQPSLPRSLAPPTRLPTHQPTLTPSLPRSLAPPTHLPTLTLSRPRSHTRCDRHCSIAGQDLRGYLPRRSRLPGQCVRDAAPGHRERSDPRQGRRAASKASLSRNRERVGQSGRGVWNHVPHEPHSPVKTTALPSPPPHQKEFKIRCRFCFFDF